MNALIKLLMLCVPVPTNIVNQQIVESHSSETVDHSVDSTVLHEVTCSVCLKRLNCVNDEWGHPVCNACCSKSRSNDKCLRCDKKVTPDLPVILNSRHMCNECACVDACAIVPLSGNIRNTVFELCEIVKMIKGELAIGQSVSIRPRGLINQIIEEDFFERSGESPGIIYGNRGHIEYFSPSEIVDGSLLSNGTYAVRMTNGNLIHVPSSCGLRYDGQKIEIRLALA